ncbi:transcriptional regulator [Paenibacillus selenitireducens]|uniref:Transcriptional regulator n=2 Tax=Paenibacillus selenitireducens TaxID=1324314 RepID=A0A1T2X1K2_9BACL|nr:transcriptional regulator [Paenibacillus selenitireducens]
MLDSFVQLPKLNEQEVTPYFIQIYEHFKYQIMQGAMAPDTRLPSIRKLAESLRISNTPVEIAYQQLIAEGFIVSKPKRGYYVQQLQSAQLFIEKPALSALSAPITPRDPRSYMYDFHISKNDFSLFPTRVWNALMKESMTNDALLQYGDPQGDRGFRDVLAMYLQRYRGLRCTAEQIVVGADIFILASQLSLLLQGRGGTLGIENPGYHAIPETFAQHGYCVTPIALEADGISFEGVIQSQVNTLYISPSHQYPRGMVMPVAKRLQLLEWARQQDAYIIEDDYDGEFRYHGRPIPSMQGLVENSPVVYVGGFAQSLAPAFCMHYMVLPTSLLAKYHELKQRLYLEQSVSRLHQFALQRFMEKGHFERHLRKMRQLYKRKHDLVIHACDQYFQGRAVLSGRDAGFHMILQVHHHKSAEELVMIAESVDIRITPMSFTWWDHPDPHALEFMIGFGGIPEERIEEGIKLLSEVWFS